MPLTADAWQSRKWKLPDTPATLPGSGANVQRNPTHDHAQPHFRHVAQPCLCSPTGATMPAPETPTRARIWQQAPDTSAALLLALTAVYTARVQLDRYAHATDAPAWQVIDAADLLEAVHDKLAEATRGTP